MADAKTSAKKFYLGTGRRKTAVARVRLAEGSGKITINGRGLADYFTEDKDRAAVMGPLQLAEMSNKLDVFVNANGGGFTGQAGAIHTAQQYLRFQEVGPAALLEQVIGQHLFELRGKFLRVASEAQLLAGGEHFFGQLREQTDGIRAGAHRLLTAHRLDLDFGAVLFGD